MSEQKNNLYLYDRNAAIVYAKTWALGRNKRYTDFEKMGGDCTNFASQVIFAGGCPMNYSRYGWYFNSLRDRAPAWTSVKHLYQFLTSSKAIGPQGIETDIHGIEVGDIVQLNFGHDEIFDHSPVVIEIKSGKRALNKIMIAAHSIDRINYPLSNYLFDKIRFIHILGYRK
ncbi:MAG: amidase domain-containing protein [Bacillota bacterium]